MVPALTDVDPCQAFPISPRLSPPAIAGLLQAANARRIISQSMLKPLLTAALSKITSPNYSPQVEDLWSIYDIFPTLKSGSTESALEEGPYPERDTPFNLDEPVAVLHSSGSTGLPKAVFQTHRIVLQWASSSTSLLFIETMSRSDMRMYRLLY